MRKTSTIFIIAILSLGIIATADFTSAQTDGDPYIRVQWQVVDDFNEFENSATHSQWIFGPQPSVWIGFEENLTSIEETEFRVEIDSPLLVNITVPKSFVGEGNIMDTVKFWGSARNVTDTCIFVLEYNATSDVWTSMSLVYTRSSEVPSMTEFIELTEVNCEYTETSDEYEVVFALTFIAEIIEEVFWTGMQVIDQEGRPTSPSWLARLQSGTFETPPIGLGVSVESGVFSLPEYYYAEIVDENGNLLHWVDSYDNFTFNIQANTPFDEVLVPFTYLTYDSDYIRTDYNFTMPQDMNDPLTLFDEDLPCYPLLTFVYNGTHSEAVVTYLDNVTWDWTPSMNMWIPQFEFLVNETFDLSEFFILYETEVLYDGAHVTWTGCFTDSVDLNPHDPYNTGGVIKPDPWMWKTINEDGEQMYAHPDIERHNTVYLSYRDTFMEGFLYKDGVIAHKADQGDVLNLSLVVHAPGEDVNGTSYIFLNITNMDIDGTLYDIDGALIQVDRENLTVWLSAVGWESNDTHYWHQSIFYQLTMDLKDDTSWNNATIVRWVFTSDHAFVGIETEQSSNLITILDHSFAIGEKESTFDFDIRFEMDAPSMKVEEAGVKSGFHYAHQLNMSLAGANSWELHPPTVNWTDSSVSGSDIQYFQKEIIWSPAHFILGDIEIWEPQKWVITEDGAIDLDGNVFTTADQYYVKRTGVWEDHGNITVEGMRVGVEFNPSPSPTDNGDEFVSWSWMGVATMVVEFEANEYFYWYHADDFSLLNQSEIEAVQETMWADMTDGIPLPGYDWIAWLSVNRTVDLSGITGLDTNSWSNSWFAWGTQQAFQVATDENVTQWASFRAEYAGLLIFNDIDPDGEGPLEANNAPDFTFEEGQIETEEVTHIVLIDEIESIELRRPFDATNDTGDVYVDADTEVTFGISIYNVDVIIYPLQIENSDGLRGPWAFRESYEGALGLNSTNFDYWVTHANVTEMSFDISFTVDMVAYDPDDRETWNHATSFKVDQRFGNWTLDEFDNSVLEGRGLAVNFFAVLGTATRTQYSAGAQPVTDTNGDSLDASYYQFGSEDSPYANVTMGGLPYTSGLDGHSQTHISGSSSAPIGAFSLMFESNSGSSITGWNIDASMLFMTAGYTEWGGYEIICDPVFVSYSSAHQTPMSTTTTTTTDTTTVPTTTPTTTIPTTSGSGQMVLVAGVLAVAVILCVLVRRRR